MILGGLALSNSRGRPSGFLLNFGGKSSACAIPSPNASAAEGPVAEDGGKKDLSAIQRVDWGRHDRTPARPIGNTGIRASLGSGWGFEKRCHQAGLSVNGSLRIERSSSPKVQIAASAAVALARGIRERRTAARPGFEVGASVSFDDSAAETDMVPPWHQVSLN